MKLRMLGWKLCSTGCFFFFCKFSIILKFLQNKFLFKKNGLFVFCTCFTPQGFPNHFIHHILTFESQDLTFWGHFYQLSVLAYFGISFSACYNFRACSFSVPYRFQFNFSCWSSFCNSFVLRLIAGVKPSANSTSAEVRRSGSAALRHHPEPSGWCPDSSHGGHLFIFQRLRTACSFLTIELIFPSPDSHQCLTSPSQALISQLHAKKMYFLIINFFIIKKNRAVLQKGIH